MSIKLPQPSLLDFSKLDKCDNVKIVIHNTKHKFATDANYSGTDEKTQPIFGSKVYINGQLFSKSTFGLPFIRFPQGSHPAITYKNKTLYTFNIHYHGLNTTGIVDGVAMEAVFGKNTLLGPQVTFQFPKITNNQSLLWFHGHNMFVSMELIYGGIIGLLQIVDKQTQWLTDEFIYGDNNILLTALDMDLTDKGTQTFANLVNDENRSTFTVINGISAVNWYSSDASVPFINSLYHITNRNLVKIDILNASLNWRVFHLGVCDKDHKIQPFYLVQVDSGLINPQEFKMININTSSRVGILIDLTNFKDNEAYLFFHDYDLTEIFESTPAFTNEPNNPTLTATIPDFPSPNSTPYPTPIPDPTQQNQQQNPTNLNYPIVPLIPQIEQILENGSIKQPKKSFIRPFLKIIYNEKNKCELSLTKTISAIRETVFGENYNQYKSIIKQPFFEYDSKFNYLDFLNKEYYYNLPNTNPSTPTRNFFLFPEPDINAFAGGNPNGTTEYVDSANRIMVDLWNSQELNLNWALEQYFLTPNSYKPPTLPTSKFRIYKTNDQYSNTAMISNDTLTVQLFTQSIAYGNLTQLPYAEVTIIFPPTQKDLNLQQWIDLVNDTFDSTLITIPSLPNPVKLSTLLTCDWSFFPYALDFLYQKTAYIKSAVIKTLNTSNYWVRFLGRWPLLQFFGKPLTGDTLDPSSLMMQLRTKQQKVHAKLNKPIRAKITQPSSDTQKTNSLFVKCDEFGTYGTLDADIQQIFPFYATSDGDTQLPIACMKRNAELIIQPQQTYIGLYDGYLNDNLNSFSVKLKSNEIWIYTNGDCADSHPLHFHLTSGYVVPDSNYVSRELVSYKNAHNPLIYSKDIYQIGPQETIAFHLTWPHYSSYDTTKSPNIRGVGGVIHCHFLQHNDSNSMIIQYFVDPEFPTCNHHIVDSINSVNTNNTTVEIKKSSCCKSEKN